MPFRSGLFYVQGIRIAELTMKNGKVKISTIVILAVVLIAAGYFGRGYLLREMTIYQLLNENKQLKDADADSDNNSRAKLQKLREERKP